MPILASTPGYFFVPSETSITMVSSGLGDFFGSVLGILIHFKSSPRQALIVFLQFLITDHGLISFIQLYCSCMQMYQTKRSLLPPIQGQSPRRWQNKSAMSQWRSRTRSNKHDRCTYLCNKQHSWPKFSHAELPLKMLIRNLSQYLFQC